MSGVTRTFKATGREILAGVDLTVHAGEFVAIVGRSGSGKSTVLTIAAGLDVAYGGSAKLCGHELRTMSDRDRTVLRRETVGMVFQLFHLVSDWTVEENVALSQMFLTSRARPSVSELLEQVGLQGFERRRPTELSGGQRQRVAIARALYADGPLLLCDEPTGSLDRETGQSVLELFAQLHKIRAKTLVVVTHDDRVTAIADRVLFLEDGRLREEQK